MMKLGQLDPDKLLLKQNKLNSIAGFFYLLLSCNKSYFTPANTSLRWGGKPSLMSFGLPLRFFVATNQLE